VNGDFFAVDILGAQRLADRLIMRDKCEAAARMWPVERYCVQGG